MKRFEKLIGEYNASNVLQRRFVHGPGIDEPIVWYEGSGTTDRRYLVQDERGSVVAINAATNSVNAYDEYGQPAATNSGRFQYTGQMWLAEAGVYHYKARAYVPQLGRFAQTDPIGFAGGMNVYAYVGNDPVNFIDPLGLQEEEDEIVVTARRRPRQVISMVPVPFDWGSAFQGGGGVGGAGSGGGSGGDEDGEGEEETQCPIPSGAVDPVGAGSTDGEERARVAGAVVGGIAGGAITRNRVGVQAGMVVGGASGQEAYHVPGDIRYGLSNWWNDTVSEVREFMDEARDNGGVGIATMNSAPNRPRPNHPRRCR